MAYAVRLNKRQSLSSLSKLSLEDFRNVEQSANAARNAQKAKYQGMLSRISPYHTITLTL